MALKQSKHTFLPKNCYRLFKHYINSLEYNFKKLNKAYFVTVKFVVVWIYNYIFCWYFDHNNIDYFFKYFKVIFGNH